MAVFFSDERVPHAVLPSGTEERVAVTLWYSTLMRWSLRLVYAPVVRTVVHQR